MDPELQKYLKWLSKLGILVLAFLAIYLLFTYLLPLLGKGLALIPVLLLPFILAIILAFLIEPLVRIFEIKARMNRAGATLLSLIIAVGGVSYLLFLIISIIVKELSKLYPQVAGYSDQIASRIARTISDFKIFYLNLNLPPKVEASIQSNLGNSLEALKELLNNSINGLLQILTMLPGIFVFMIIVAVATFLIVKDRALIRSFTLHLLPGTAQSKTLKVISELFKALIGFLKAYSILISITAIITMVSLRILNTQYAITLGILVGLCDILPVLGPGTIFLPWIIWEFASGNSRMGVSLIVVYVIISVVRQILEPKIVGDNIGLHPLATLISLYVGLQLGGLIGMILGPVSLVIFMACYRAGIFSRLDWRK